MKIAANTLSTNDKKDFEAILKAMSKETINSQGDLTKFLKGFGEHLGHDLKELLEDAVHHLRKQNNPHKWSRGGPEDQIKTFNKDSFDKLLKFHPDLNKIWEGEFRANSGHTPESLIFLPENSAFASTINPWHLVLAVIDGTETDEELNELAEIAIGMFKKPQV